MIPLKQNFASDHRKVTCMIMFQMEISQNSLAV